MNYQLPELPDPFKNIIRAKQEDARSAQRLTESTNEYNEALESLATETYEVYADLCDGALCCREYDCYGRADLDIWCAEHRKAYGVE